MSNRTARGEDVVNDHHLFALCLLPQRIGVDDFVIPWMENATIFRNSFRFFRVLCEEVFPAVQVFRPQACCQFLSQSDRENVSAAAARLRDENRIGRILQPRLEFLRVFCGPGSFRESS
ncbi:MAG: hypothetical protein HQM00_02355 [Magnetococcales bacterium]|nr:hypothetical protein [Magnetococcales bacterium]